MTIHFSSARDRTPARCPTQIERRAALGDQPRQHLDHAAGADAAVDLDRKPSFVHLVGDGQALQLLAVGAPVEHEVVRPHLVGATRRVRPWPRPGACAFAAACAAPAASPFATDGAHVRSSSDDRRGRGKCGCAGSHNADTAPTAPPSAPAPAYPSRPSAAITQRRPRYRDSVQARRGRGPPPAIRYSRPASRHAHHFFAAISFITSISRSRSATSFFSRPFSASSCFSRRDIVGCSRPKRFLHV